MVIMVSPLPGKYELHSSGSWPPSTGVAFWLTVTTVAAQQQACLVLPYRPCRPPSFERRLESRWNPACLTRPMDQVSRRPAPSQPCRIRAVLPLTERRCVRRTEQAPVPAPRPQVQPSTWLPATPSSGSGSGSGSGRGRASLTFTQRRRRAHRSRRYCNTGSMHGVDGASPFSSSRAQKSI